MVLTNSINIVEVFKECTCDKIPHDKERSQAQPRMIETHNELFLYLRRPTKWKLMMN